MKHEEYDQLTDEEKRQITRRLMDQAPVRWDNILKWTALIIVEWLAVYGLYRVISAFVRWLA